MKKVRLEFRYQGEVASITLDDGKGNVLDSIMMAELHEILRQFQDMPNIKVITFEGAGKHFSFGASVEEHRREQADQMLSSFHQLFFSLMDLRIPTISKLTGQCLGGGMELAIMCNMIFADATAKMGQPEIVLGVFPPPASLILPLKIGSARAESLLLSGSTIAAQHAHHIGLVHEVFVTREELRTGTDAWIERHILPKSASSLRFAVEAARREFNRVLRGNLSELQSVYVSDLMQTHDANEGIAAFLEKRNPEWKNC